MSARRALLWGALLYFVYAGLRTLLQRLIPFHDWPSYLRQDLAITGLRLAAALGAFWIASRRWDAISLGWRGWRLGGGLSWGAAVLVWLAMVLGALSQRADASQPAWVRGIEVGIAAAVALNEELGFRGLFYCAARELWGRSAAVWSVGLIFVLMHLGYQPLFHLPKVFCVGLCLTALRDRGATLPALAALHFLLDLPFALLLSGELANPALYWTSAGVAAMAAGLALLAPRQPAPAEGRLAFFYGTLRSGQAGARELRLDRRADWVGPASIRARLFQVGDYPAAVLGGEGRLEGELWRLRDAELLAELDAYELPDGYTRDRVEAETEKGVKVEAWAWVFERPPEV